LLDEEHPPKDIDGRLWVDRIRIDEAKCIQCGDCVNACTEENPANHALTSIIQKRFQAIQAEEEVEEPTLLQEILRMSQEEREEFWRKQFQKCIKCHGCIDVCPVHDTEAHGLDLSTWVEAGQVPPPYPLFHLIRAYQVWDTCILCGECEKTCPAHIPLKSIQDLIRYLPPEKVFEVIPGLEKEAQDAILDFVNWDKSVVKEDKP